MQKRRNLPFFIEGLSSLSVSETKKGEKLIGYDFRVIPRVCHLKKFIKVLEKKSKLFFYLGYPLMNKFFQRGQVDREFSE